MNKILLSDRSLKVRPQPMFNIMSMATKLEKENNKKIIHLEIGNTGFFKNKKFLKILKAETKLNNMHYVGSAGIYKLREKIIKKHQINHNNLSFENIIISSANSLITMFLYNLVNENEKVLILRPYFPTYDLSCKALNLNAVYYDLNEKNNWEITADEFLDLYKKNNFKAVIINNPSNPSGKIMKNHIINQILKICETKGIFCLLDYTYYNLTFDKTEKPKVFFNKYSFYIFSYSKDAAIPTLRLGYGLGDAKVIKKIQEMNSLIYSCYPAISQNALLRYIPYENSFLREINNSLIYRVKLAVKILNKSTKLNVIIPDGGIYLFVKILDNKINGDQFAKKLLSEYGVCVCPGSSFGSSYVKYFRINLAGKFFELKIGLNKIVLFFDRLNAKKKKI